LRKIKWNGREKRMRMKKKRKERSIRGKRKRKKEENGKIKARNDYWRCVHGCQYLEKIMFLTLGLHSFISLH